MRFDMMTFRVSERTTLRVQEAGQGTPGREPGLTRDRVEWAHHRARREHPCYSPQPIRPLRRFLHCLADDIVGAVGRILQRTLHEVSISLRHRWVRMTEDLLDLIERPSAVHQKRRILVPEVVDSQMGYQRSEI